MRRLTQTCKVCNKTLQVIEEFEQTFPIHEICSLKEADSHFLEVPTKINLVQYIVQLTKCGHTIFTPKVEAAKHLERNLLWDRLLPFQKEFVEFAEAHNCRCICRDEMGLGKTIEAASVLRENADLFTDNYTKYCVVVTPVGGIYQWEEELIKWLGVESPKTIEQITLRPQVVVVGKQKLSTLSNVVIVPWSKLGDPTIQRQLIERGIASFIVDECHFYKDQDSKRTQNLLKLVETTGPKAPLLLLSGTLVENRIMELFVPLNLMDSQFFYSKKVLDRMCLHSYEGKTLSLDPYWRDRFFKRTSPYMIGRKKAEVNIPLPKLEKHYHWQDPSQFKANEEFAKAYNKTLDEMESLLEAPALSASCLIGLMQQLRHLTGKMKILNAAVFIDKFMKENPNEKLAVGIHHIGVRESLAALLQHHKPLQMSDEDPKVKDEIERGFRNGKSNLLICSILSAGVGRNFQFCRNAIVLERQWNRSKEDQFEQRFHRILTDSEGRIRSNFTDSDNVNIHYLQAENSFDRFFDGLIHLKGIICDSADESIEELPEENFIIELAQAIVKERIKWVG